MDLITTQNRDTSLMTDFAGGGRFLNFLRDKKHVKNFVYKIDNMCSDRSHAAQT